MKTYCIREDYEPRTTAETFVDDPRDYWNDTRLARSRSYQYYVYKKAAEIVASKKDCRFADIGCGYPIKTRELILPLTEHITLIDQPSMKGIVEEHFPNFSFIPQNLEEPTETLKDAFDCIICDDVIEHLLNPDPLLDFLKQILAPDGIVVISTPERDMERGPNNLSSPKVEHVREWNSSEFICYLEQEGFNVESHSTMPKRKLTSLEELYFRKRTRPSNKRYSGCQTAVCTLKES